jgi:hypothetical protein
MAEEIRTNYPTLFLLAPLDFDDGIVCSNIKIAIALGNNDVRPTPPRPGPQLRWRWPRRSGPNPAICRRGHPPITLLFEHYDT